MLYLGSLSDSPLFEASNCRAKGREKLGMWNRGSPQKELAHFFLGLVTWAGCNGQCFVHLRAPMPQYSKYCTSFHPNAHFFGLSVSPVCLRHSRTGPPAAHALSRCHYGCHYDWWLHPIRQPHIQGHQRSSFRLSPCFEEVEVIYPLAPPLSKLWKLSRISIKTLKTLKNLFIYNT